MYRHHASPDKKHEAMPAGPHGGIGIVDGEKQQKLTRKKGEHVTNLFGLTLAACLTAFLCLTLLHPTKQSIIEGTGSLALGSRRRAIANKAIANKAENEFSTVSVETSSSVAVVDELPASNSEPVTMTTQPLLKYIRPPMSLDPRMAYESEDAPPFPVDAVFMWVNGSEPKFIKLLHNKTKANGGTTEDHAERFRDIGQLRYGMRSIWMNAPWIRRIILVVWDRATQTPNWLNTSHPSISVVEHPEIWEDPSLLPTLSSSPTATNLHRIPGISEVFLYLEDDYIIAQRVTKDSFWSGPHEQILCDAWLPPDPYGRVGDKWGKSLQRLQPKFDARYGPRRMARVHCHSPILINSTIWRDALDEWRPEFNAMLRDGPFRTDHDLLLQFTYAQHVMRKKTPSGVSKYPFSVVRDRKVLFFETLTDSASDNLKIFAKILANPRMFVDLQDGLKSPSDKTIQEIIDFLEKMVPMCAPWEIDCVSKL
jgi:hypothetical protein